MLVNPIGRFQNMTHFSQFAAVFLSADTGTTAMLC